MADRRGFRGEAGNLASRTQSPTIIDKASDRPPSSIGHIVCESSNGSLAADLPRHGFASNAYAASKTPLAHQASSYFDTINFPIAKPPDIWSCGANAMPFTSFTSRGAPVFASGG